MSRAPGHSSLYDFLPDETKSPVAVRSVAGFLFVVPAGLLPAVPVLVVENNLFVLRQIATFAHDFFKTNL